MIRSVMYISKEPTGDLKVTRGDWVICWSFTGVTPIVEVTIRRTPQA